MDAKGRITDFNRAAEVTFGYERDEVIGEFLSETLITVEMRGRHTRGLEKFRRTGEGPILGRRIETIAKRKDGIGVSGRADRDPCNGQRPCSFQRLSP